MNGTANGKAKLETNVPFTATLKFANGLPVESQYGGAEMLFTLTDGQKLYLPVPVADKMKTLGGREFVICKKQMIGSKKINWVVNRADIFPPEPALCHAELTRRNELARQAAKAYMQRPVAPSPIEPTYDYGENWGDPPPTPREEKAAVAASMVSALTQTRPPSAPSQVPAAANAQQIPSRMTAALLAAIDSTAAATTYAKTQGITLKFSEEDIRCVASTIYIQNARNAA